MDLDPRDLARGRWRRSAIMVCLVLAPIASPAEAPKWASRSPPEAGEGGAVRGSSVLHRVRRTVKGQNPPRAGGLGTSAVLFLAHFPSRGREGRCPRHAPATARAPLFAGPFGGLRSGVRVCVGRGGRNLACGTSIVRTPRLMVWRTYEVYTDEFFRQSNCDLFQPLLAWRPSLLHTQTEDVDACA